MSSQRSSVTVLGLGLMGSTLARTFLAAGHDVTVWNRTPGRDGALAAAGARSATSAPEAVTTSPLVVVCLLDRAAVHAVLDTLDGGALTGRTVADLTTGTPDESRAVAERVTALGARYLDGKILATPSLVGTAAATLLLSGPEDLVAEHGDVLGAIGTVTSTGDDPGLAALHDLAMLTVMWSVLGGYYHAAELLRSAGVPAADVATTTMQLLPAVAGMLPGEATAIDTASYATDESTIEVNAAGLHHLTRATRELGLRDDIPAALRALADEQLAAGNGGLALASVVDLIRKG
jgi:3-hydroxyisobutyrate dehydrogenase-like beta-hydroxyacid dehydrogenase